MKEHNDTKLEISKNYEIFEKKKKIFFQAYGVENI